MISVHQCVMHMDGYRHDHPASRFFDLTEGDLRTAVIKRKAACMGKAGKAYPGQGRKMDDVLTGGGGVQSGAAPHPIYLSAGSRFKLLIIFVVVHIGKTESIVRAADGGRGIDLVILPNLAVDDTVAERRGLIGRCQRFMQIVQEKGSILVPGAAVGDGTIYVYTNAEERLFKTAEECEVVLTGPAVHVK